ncbi:IPT/TIG domain-containing protein [Paramicrobacterium humi]|uniref:IPT/TIG domain-containing protein n=1 Tax=Paramicrobacterium humi TaxID=640635 RepID=A0A1H4JGH4_9MICO|nr:amidase domain-containing protein [Microbacterium humi]SEB45165.1 IPT/TIG domain-containing protein [Microbacterium humi]
MPRAARSRSAIAAALALSALLLGGCAAGPGAASTPVRPVPSAPAAAAAIPSVASMSPSTGSVSGGDTVTLTGASLGTVSAVEFGGEAASEVTVVDENTVTAVVPHAAEYQAGSVDVSVRIGEEAVTPKDALDFDYAVVSPVDKQLQYAFDHWDDYNIAAWGDYNPLGGDCANFVSQTLVARGWQQTPTWHNNGGRATSAWSYVPAMDNWLKSNPEVTRLSDDQRSDVKVGDIAIFDWTGTGRRDHVMIVSDVVPAADGSVDIKLIGHNIDYDYRDLDETLTEEHPGGQVWFYSVPA